MNRSIDVVELIVLGGLAACAMIGGIAGCTTGTQLRAQAEEIQSRTQAIHDRAVRCAPREFAVAESQIKFGLYELDQGEFRRAKPLIYRAERYLKLADKLSKHDACQPEKASMKVDGVKNDQDGDGIPDAEDECPLDPEDLEGFEDEDGCPDEDNDDDGITDAKDQCRNVPETKSDTYLDGDGCPDPDNDADGLVDLNDNCPSESEDFDGFEDADGCADQDNDEDGIADTLDECPNEAEDYDGDVDDDGCPEQRKRVDVTKKEIELNEKVHFAFDKAKIQSKSYPLLNEVATVLKSNPNIKVRIEGHTDSRGNKQYNLKLSQRRAQSVVDYLVKQGIERSRLKPKGFGERKPIASNRTKEGRAANRRVEILITDR